MAKRKILIIDDEKGFAQLVKLNLESTGCYEVQVELKGSLGLETARTSKPDLILLDVMMPDMVGGEVARRLKADQDTKHIPVVFLTATVLQEAARSAGVGRITADIYIAKPASIDEIIKCIEQNISTGNK